MGVEEAVKIEFLKNAHDSLLYELLFLSCWIVYQLASRDYKRLDKTSITSLESMAQISTRRNEIISGFFQTVIKARKVEGKA